MKENLPIIIVHKGDSFYLEPALRQTRKFNPNNHIYLISDESTNHYDFIEHVNITDYMSSAEQLKEAYVHMSINPYFYELFCIQRWFIILEFVKKHNYNHFLCIDSDVMLYCQVDDVFEKWYEYDMTICQPEGPQYTLFNKDSLEKFCDYIYSHYTVEDKLAEVKKWHQHRGISDMTFFNYYAQQPNIQFFNTAQVVEGTCFEFNMKVHQGFEMKGRLKKIYWREGLPYGKEIASGKLIRFNALHFQGGVKHKLNRYIYRDLPFIPRCWKNILWLFNPKRLKSRVNELKKIVGNKQMFAYFIQKRVLGK